MKAIVKSPLHHDGRVYEIGSEVDLTDKQAKSLEAIGVVEIVSTIVDEADEKVPSGSAQEDQGKAQEEAPKTAKKTSKRRAEADDE